MFNLLVDSGEVSFNARGICMLVCAEELLAIDYLRDKLAEQMKIGKETANKMIMEGLTATVNIGKE